MKASMAVDPEAYRHHLQMRFLRGLTITVSDMARVDRQRVCTVSVYPLCVYWSELEQVHVYICIHSFIRSLHCLCCIISDPDTGLRGNKVSPI